MGEVIQLPVDELVARYAAGENTREIARAYTVSHHTVRRRLLGAGIILRASNEQRTVRLPLNELAARYDGGESIRDLCRAYRVGDSTMRRALRAAGVRMRDCGQAGGGQRKPGGPLFIWLRYLATTGRDGHHEYIHRARWEAQHGPIPKDHVVHHINGNPLDNRIENLAGLSRPEHTRLHGCERAKARQCNQH